MSFSGRNNSKITNRPSGGGNALQGLAPKATHFFKAPFTGQQYSTGSGDGKTRFKLVCMNQLGGIGRGRSQFGSTADGINCKEEEWVYRGSLTFNQIYRPEFSRDGNIFIYLDNNKKLQKIEYSLGKVTTIPIDASQSLINDIPNGIGFIIDTTSIATISADNSFNLYDLTSNKATFNRSVDISYSSNYSSGVQIYKQSENVYHCTYIDNNNNLKIYTLDISGNTSTFKGDIIVSNNNNSYTATNDVKYIATYDNSNNTKIYKRTDASWTMLQEIINTNFSWESGNNNNTFEQGYGTMTGDGSKIALQNTNSYNIQVYNINSNFTSYGNEIKQHDNFITTYFLNNKGTHIGVSSISPQAFKIFNRCTDKNTNQCSWLDFNTIIYKYDKKSATWKQVGNTIKGLISSINETGDFIYVITVNNNNFLTLAYYKLE